MNTPGPVALVGSGEYTDAMNATDRALLAALPAGAAVAVIPTASGLEPGMPEVWNERGVRHFTALGARVTPLLITQRAHCFDDVFVRGLRAADFFYFSGGNPNYVIETWHDTPAWAAVLERWRAGAVLVGCSAGAMMLGSHTIRVREIMGGLPPKWAPAMNVVPGVAVLPHFDRMRNFVTALVLKLMLKAAPDGLTVIGVDEDTAVVRLGGAWRASGRQTVSAFAGGVERRYRPGDVVPLDDGRAAQA